MPANKRKALILFSILSHFLRDRNSSLENVNGISSSIRRPILFTKYVENYNQAKLTEIRLCTVQGSRLKISISLTRCIKNNDWDPLLLNASLSQVVYVWCVGNSPSLLR